MKEGEKEVFLDVAFGDGVRRRLKIRLFSSKCPRTTRNFMALCEGSHGVGEKTKARLHFVGSPFHRIIRGFMAQGGDISKGNGKGGESIYGGSFEDENLELKHDRPGLLSMANCGPNTNGSQFFVTFAECRHLDGTHVVFGEVFESDECMQMLENVQVGRDDRPLRKVQICASGVLGAAGSAHPGEEKGRRKNESSFGGKAARKRRFHENAEDETKPTSLVEGTRRKGRGSFKYITGTEEDMGVTPSYVRSRDEGLPPSPIRGETVDDNDDDDDDDRADGMAWEEPGQTYGPPVGRPRRTERGRGIYTEDRRRPATDDSRKSEGMRDWDRGKGEQHAHERAGRERFSARPRAHMDAWNSDFSRGRSAERGSGRRPKPFHGHNRFSGQGRDNDGWPRNAQEPRYKRYRASDDLFAHDSSARKRAEERPTDRRDEGDRFNGGPRRLGDDKFRQPLSPSNRRSRGRAGTTES